MFPKIDELSYGIKSTQSHAESLESYKVERIASIYQNVY